MPQPTDHPLPLSPQSAPTPSIFRRMACWCYEGVLLFAVIFIASYLFSSLSQTRHALENRAAQQAFLFLVLGIYFGWFWSRGQTLAMKTWHIRVVGLDGQPPSQKRALGRYLLSWMWFLPPLAAVQVFNLDARFSLVASFLWICSWAALALLHKDRQFLHDALAGTRLIDSKADQAAARAQG